MSSPVRFVLGVLVLALVCGLGLRLWKIDGIWANNRAGYNGACYWGLFGLNYHRYGLADSNGAPFHMRLDAPGHPVKLDYYVRHPFAISLLLALSFELFGAHEWAARLVPFLFTFGAVLLAWPVGRRLAGPVAAGLFAAFLALLPMSVVYGQQINSEGPLLFFLLLTLIPYLRYRETGSRKALWLAALAYLPATLFDWPAFLLGGVITADAYLLARRRGSGPLVFIAVPVTTFVLFVLYAALVFTSPKMGILHVLRGAVAGTSMPDLGDWVAHQAGFLENLYTLPVLGLAAIGLVLRLCEWWRERRMGAGQAAGPPFLLALLLAFGLAVPLVFLGRSIDHDYYSFSLLPAIALAAAVALDRLVRLLWRGRLAVVAGACVLVPLGSAASRSYSILRDWPRAGIQALIDDPWLAEHTRPADALVAADPIFGYLAYYRDTVVLSRTIRGMQLAHYRELMTARAGRTGRVTYLVPLPLKGADRGLAAELAAAFPSREITLRAPRVLQRGLFERRFLAFDLTEP